MDLRKDIFLANEKTYCIIPTKNDYSKRVLEAGSIFQCVNGAYITNDYAEFKEKCNQLGIDYSISERIL